MQFLTAVWGKFFSYTTIRAMGFMLVNPSPTMSLLRSDFNIFHSGCLSCACYAHGGCSTNSTFFMSSSIIRNVASFPFLMVVHPGNMFVQSPRSSAAIAPTIVGYLLSGLGKRRSSFFSSARTLYNQAWCAVQVCNADHLQRASIGSRRLVCLRVGHRPS